MEIRTVGVIGCGLMGSGIAQVCAQSGFETVVREVSQEVLDRGIGRIESILGKDVGKGILATAVLPGLDMPGTQRCARSSRRPIFPTWPVARSSSRRSSRTSMPSVRSTARSIASAPLRRSLPLTPLR